MQLENLLRDVRHFKVLRRTEGDDAGPRKYLRMRTGVADMFGRAQVGKKINGRLAESLASVAEKKSLGELTKDLGAFLAGADLANEQTECDNRPGKFNGWRRKARSMKEPSDRPERDGEATRDEETKDYDEPPASLSLETRLPELIGRYRIKRVLGEGGFGIVYLAHDQQLGRSVAIKVPRKERLSEPKTYLEEARILAGLDHPNIVPVHDVGSTSDGLCYVVSKLIEGRDLAKFIKESGQSHLQKAEIVAEIADALHFAHRNGLVHRDVKPGNILIDSSGKAYLADFGLALKDEDFGKEKRFAGTPAYMSPEQARGDGDRVDGRSDVFSLGVVFYELLIGKRPFGGGSRPDLLGQITEVEARPPRQIDDSIPMELERICLKALSKRPSDRYRTAKDMADDIRLFLSGSNAKAWKSKQKNISVNAAFGRMGCSVVIALCLMIMVGGVSTVIEWQRSPQLPNNDVNHLSLRKGNGDVAFEMITTVIGEAGTPNGFGPLMAVGAVVREEFLWNRFMKQMLPELARETKSSSPSFDDERRIIGGS